MTSDTSDPLAAIAPFYDLDLDGLDDDVAMYAEFARRGGSDVLELGCGTGRVALPLVEAGHSVVGVDLSAAMLEIAQRRADAQRTPASALRLMRADFRDLDLGREFPTVLMPLGGLQHMETAADVTRALEVIARHLGSGGVAVVDIESPFAEDFQVGPQPLVAQWTRPQDGSVVTKLVAVEGRPARGVREVTYHFDVQPPEGALHRVSCSFVLRVITAGELELAAQIAGLNVTGLYGDYDLAPYVDGAERIIAVLEHAERGA